MIGLFKTSFRANSLFYALIVLLLCGILLTALISIAYFFRVERDLYQEEVRLLHNARSGLSLLSSTRANFENEWISLYGQSDDSVKLTKYRWGAYYALSAKATKNGSSRGKCALAGTKPQNRFALLLNSRSYDPLTLSGKTSIIGDAYLPEAGVERGYIEGQSFIGSRLINGRILNNEDINFLALEELSTYLRNSDRIANKTLNFYDQMEDSLHQSFSEGKVRLTSVDSISIRDMTISGAHEITSRSAIFVSNTASLEHVLLIAPRVYIESGFNGKIQVIASETIELGENVDLNYPSSLIIMNENKLVNSNILIDKSCSVKGVVALMSRNKNSVIRINHSEVIGEVLSDSFVELKGSIFGSVVTNHFLLKTPSSIYEDHLLNATVDISQLPNEFVGMYSDSETKALEIVEYVED